MRPPRENVIAARVYSPDDIAHERPNMIEGGYSTGSTIASQLGRYLDHAAAAA
jgi:hypothetical protein